MTTVTTHGLRVRPIWYDLARDYRGALSGSPSILYQHDRVVLSSGAMIAIGGEPLRVGRTWGVYLDLLYVSSAGVVTAQDLTTMDPSGSKMTIFDPLTMVLNATRNVVQISGTGITPSPYQLSLVGAGAPGRIKVLWHEAETVSSYPPVGSWAWIIELNINHVIFVAASGVIDALPTVPVVP